MRVMSDYARLKSDFERLQAEHTRTVADLERLTAQYETFKAVHHVLMQLLASHAANMQSHMQRLSESALAQLQIRDVAPSSDAPPERPASSAQSTGRSADAEDVQIAVSNS